MLKQFALGPDMAEFFKKILPTTKRESLGFTLIMNKKFLSMVIDPSITTIQKNISQWACL